MDRAQKAAAVDYLKGVFSTANVVVVAQNKGLSVAEMTALRTKVREAGGGLKVIKNRLAKIALNETDHGEAGAMFAGPCAIAFSDDPVAAPKALADFAKANEKVVIVGGFMGATQLDEHGVKALATLPSLDELRGKLVGLIQQPAARIAQVLQAPGGQVARVLSAYARKDAA